MAVRRPFTDGIEELVQFVSPRIRAAFLEVVGRIRGEWEVSRIEALIASGRIEQALERVAFHAAWLGDEVVEAAALAASRTAAFLRTRGVDLVTARFDTTNVRAVLTLQKLRLRTVEMFTTEQVTTARQLLTRGVADGINPRQQAIALRESLGLTPYHEGIVDNYRRELLAGDPKALSRKLRDRRFDATVRRAVSGEQPLSLEQVDRIQGRYRERWLAFNAESVARTHALSAVHVGSDEMYRQAVASGILNPDALERTWSSRLVGPHRRRDHIDMHGQKRGFDEPFKSGSGAELRHPGDPDAPLSEIVRCACLVITRVKSSMRARSIDPRRRVFETGADA